MAAMNEREREALRAAFGARKNAYAPYSHFLVGAALLTKRGKLYTGCNVENAAFTPTCCAERAAFCKAIGEGEREFSLIAVLGGGAEEKRLDFCPPCGVCRQFMREFCADDFEILLGKGTEEGAAWETKTYTLAQLLPLSFGKNLLK